MEKITLYVGYDPREAAVFTAFCQSVIQHTTIPVSIIPLHQRMLDFDGQQDGTNAFIFSRYLIPEMMNHDGFALFCDGDMIIRDDLKKLWDLRDATKAVQVVKHDYKTREGRKYKGSPIENDNIDYPMKNWSSVSIWNCSHPAHAILTKEFVAEAGGAFLHRFKWLDDQEIGNLPKEWNHLVREQDYNPNAKLVHFTLGAPGFANYARDDYAWEWNAHLLDSINMVGERTEEIIRRAQWRNTNIRKTG
jgi:lipopolysaccharide biosynthesis glycosyltransferase